MTKDEAIKYPNVRDDAHAQHQLENLEFYYHKPNDMTKGQRQSLFYAIEILKERVSSTKQTGSEPFQLCPLSERLSPVTMSPPDSWLDRCSNNGYERYIDKNGDRRYCDNNELVGDNPFRPCAKCGGMPNEYGDDHCIQRLGNVMNACCGHGNRMGYIQFDSGYLIEGYFTVKIKQPNGEYL